MTEMDKPFGAFFGPIGVVVISAVGAMIGHDDDDRSV
jgi:hypothetical protein